MPENPDINPLETEISFISNPEIGSFELNSKVNSERFVAHYLGWRTYRN